MPSVGEYVELLQRLEGQDLAVNAERCLRTRNRNLPCDACARACPSGCITVEEGALAVDATRCVGCGSCATACPTCALYPRNPEGIDIAKAAKATLARTDGMAVFTCATKMEQVGARLDPDTVTPVTCLARLDESLLMVMVAAGARRIRLVCGSCETCAHARGGALAEEVCANVRALLEAWGLEVRVRMTETFPRACALEAAAAYDYRRREFLLGMGGKAKVGGLQAADLFIERTFSRAGERPRFAHVTADGTLPHHLPQRHALLMDVLKTLGTPRDVSLKTRLWGHVSIDEDACNGCQMCAVFCPTGALAKHRELEAPEKARSYKLYRAPSNPNAGNEVVTEARGQRVRRHGRASASSAFTATGEAVDLVHAPSLCVGCRSCEALCPQHAITVSSRVNARDLQRGYIQTTHLKDIYASKGGPDAIRNSMSTLIDSPYLWG